MLDPYCRHSGVGSRQWPVLPPAISGPLQRSGVRGEHWSLDRGGLHLTSPAVSTCQLPRACDHTFRVGGSFSNTTQPSY